MWEARGPIPFFSYPVQYCYEEQVKEKNKTGGMQVADIITNDAN